MRERFVVTMPVRLADGRTEQVTVGSATRVGDSFELTLSSLNLVPEGSGASSAPPAAASKPRRQESSSDSQAVFPPYGKSKGMPVRGASMRDLEFYANGCRRSLADPSKSRWHDKERSLLASIEEEMARQKNDSGGGGNDEDDGFF